MMGFAYLQRDNRTIMAKATKISVYEEINQITGEVTYRQTTEFSERYGKPPVYVTTLESEITAVRMILTGRLAGIAPETIQERLRDLYA